MSLHDSLGLEDLEKAEKEAGEEEEEQEEEEEEGEEDDESADIRTTTSISAFSGCCFSTFCSGCCRPACVFTFCSFSGRDNGYCASFDVVTASLGGKGKCFCPFNVVQEFLSSSILFPSNWNVKKFESRKNSKLKLDFG